MKQEQIIKLLLFIENVPFYLAKYFVRTLEEKLKMWSSNNHTFLYNIFFSKDR